MTIPGLARGTLDAISQQERKHLKTLGLLQRAVMGTEIVNIGNGRLKRRYKVSFHHSTLPLAAFTPDIGPVDVWARQYLVLENGQVYVEWKAAWLPSSEVAKELHVGVGDKEMDWADVIHEVLPSLYAVGPQDGDVSMIDLPNCIHIAGTKGKGSTCAYIECMLRHHGRRTGYPKKTGLYTSPHLNNVQERIRINFDPLSEEKFAKYVSDVYTRLEVPKLGSDGPKYLQLLFLVSVHAFFQEGVDVAIYETHHGGEFDATNILAKPLVTAITPIGRDHINELGPTLQHVAWHKSGIFKPGVPAFSASQQPALACVLKERAEEKGVLLQFVDPGVGFPLDVPLPESPVQLENFALARAVSNEFLRQKGWKSLTALDERQAISTFSWPGRFQRLTAGSITWFLDCAHNELSLQVCAEWFARQSADLDPDGSVHRAIVFSHFSNHRDHAALLKSLAHSLSRDRVIVHDAIFVPGPNAPSEFKDEQENVLELYASHWSRIHPGSHVSKVSRPGQALDLAASVRKDKIHVLVTGSIHLIGRAIQILGA
ncbi:hypothetical protein CKM354_000632200 [Cercospora kikuchii]|uniref:tetrahydrofolate synthase n=1 Tax=Cercospora kikuchii TaxID=84275 RepID=A0A9P3FD75_9PEZI|nr:uncharacterized protein CKM354_000632200 [Cercospora kikuchii]GIZ43081.1 hypothetical protein CKM354_000632200 [Cercospora kikuchii]